MGVAIHPTNGANRRQNLNSIIQYELGEDKYKQLEEVSDAASKEYNIERVLDRMHEDWEPISAELKSHKDTGTFIMLGSSYVNIFFY